MKNREQLWTMLLKEEILKGGQLNAAKGRAAKRFNKLTRVHTS